MPKILVATVSVVSCEKTTYEVSCWRQAPVSQSRKVDSCSIEDRLFGGDVKARTR